MGERTRKRGIYLRLLVTYVVSAFAAITITSLIMAIYVRQTTIGSMSSSVRASVQRTSQVLDAMADSVKTFALELYFDRDVSKLRNLESPDVFDLSTATYRLSTFGAVLPYLESIYIYSDIGSRYYVSLPYGPTREYPAVQFYDTYIAKILHNTRHYQVLDPISRQIPLVDSAGDMQRAKGLTFVFFGPSGGNTASEGAVVLNLSQAWVQRLIGGAESSDGNATLIVDSSGHIAVDDVGDVFGPRLSNTNVVSRVLGQGRSFGYLVAKVGGQQYLVAYAPYEPFKWVLMRAVPLKDIMAGVNAIVLRAIFICVAVLLFGLVASMILSRHFLTPVRGLVSRMYLLQEEMRATRGARKSKYLKKLIALSDDPADAGAVVPDIAGADAAVAVTAAAAFDREDLDVAISIGPGSAYTVVYLLIDRVDQFSARFNAGERERLKRRIIELTGAVVRMSFPCEGVALDDERIVLIVENVESAETNCGELLTRQLAEAQNRLLSTLGISVSVIVSRLGRGVESLPGLFEEVRAAAPNKFFHGPKSIVRCDDPVETGRKEFSDFEYPTKRERAFIKLLLAGAFDKAQETLDEILSACLSYSFGTFRLVLARIVSATSSSLAEVERMRNTATGHDLDRLILELDGLESYSEVRRYFATYFEALASQMSTSTLERHRVLLKRISEILATEYSNRNLSLQYVAEKVGMSPQYLSRLYHQLRGKSIVAEINEVRILKAKRMLRTSDETVDQIVYAAGFSNSQHFFRVFRQKTGMTPREYRDTSLRQPV